MSQNKLRDEAAEEFSLQGIDTDPNLPTDLIYGRYRGFKAGWNKAMEIKQAEVDELKKRLEIKTKVEFDKAMKVQRLEAIQEKLVEAATDFLQSTEDECGHDPEWQALAQATKGEK